LLITIMSGIETSNDFITPPSINTPTPIDDSIVVHLKVYMEAITIRFNRTTFQTKNLKAQFRGQGVDEENLDNAIIQLERAGLITFSPDRSTVTINNQSAVNK